MAKTFQEFAAENLQAFGWQLTADQIPEFDTCKKVINDLVAWYNSNPEVTRRIMDECDISPGLWSHGFFNDWQHLYNCFAQSKVGAFASSYDDIVACLERAKHQVDEQPSDQISNVHDVVGDNENANAS